MLVGWAISGIHQNALNLVRVVKYKIISTAVNSSNLENQSNSRQQGNNISIKKDQEFNLYLKSNPTTGYEWIPIFSASSVSYGYRWMAETAFSSIKRMFGEHVTARKF
ncbi:MAG TPA: hypothetical protein VFJ05_06070, partial [Nitrososphaeraceae archaeon]|nr:hypothetical protein [Nitrososphaeraceae archaeon]